ncbi:MAG: hypothetical protein FWC69_01250 [Defluviitaleaceae bacterium]|nr:hypothetical protein [Defluviitaleaceae bacterium]
MFEKQYREEMQKISPSKDLIEATKMAMRKEMEKQSEIKTIKTKDKPPFMRRAITFAAAAAVMMFAIFVVNILNQNGSGNNVFSFRVYGAEMQPDGTLIWREIDITQLHGWGGYYDGEVLYISLGLWFEFEGQNIDTVEFSLEDGFFATQYIGNWGQTPGVPRAHVGIPPCFTTSRLVQYGHEFDKVGNTITFGNTMPDDILLFWASYDIGMNEWMFGDMVLEIGVKATFDNGEVQQQQLVLNFQDNPGGGTMWTPEGVLPEPEGFLRLDPLTAEQHEYLMSTPLESFMLIEDSIQTFAGDREVFIFYVDEDYYPLNIGVPIFPEYWSRERVLENMPWFEDGVWRTLLGSYQGVVYIAVIEMNEDSTFTGRVYTTQLD